MSNIQVRIGYGTTMIEYEVPINEDGTSPMWGIAPSNQSKTHSYLVRYEVARGSDDVGIMPLSGNDVLWIDREYLNDPSRAILITLAHQEESRARREYADVLEKIARFDLEVDHVR